MLLFSGILNRLMEKYYPHLKTHQKVYMFFKRGFDIFFSFIGIILLSPLMLICAIIIKCTSKGPVFFRQERLGKNKKVFRIFKFRSLKVGTPEVAPSSLSVDEQKKMTYKWGSFMRKTSLDEVPQLFNIFVGDMSFVGPRPGAANNEEKLIREREKYVPGAYDIRPGLTGYAQIKQHRGHKPNVKAYLDHLYVLRLNIFFDIEIFVYTIFMFLGVAKGR